MNSVAHSTQRLTVEQRELLAELWRLRAENERTSAAAFSVVHQAALALCASPWVTERTECAAAQEQEHARLCLEIAQQYAGKALHWEAAQPVRGPALAGCTERVAHLLIVTEHCCLSETIAVSYLQHCKQQCEVNELRQVLQGLLRDELVHARLGWAVLGPAQLCEAERTELERALPELFAASYNAWIGGWERLSRGLPTGHGFVDNPCLIQLVSESLQDVVLPGFEQVGIPGARARNWLRSQLSTCAG